MITTREIRSLAQRLAKAEQLVAEGAVFPVAGLAGYAVVRNGDGNSMYLVRFDAGSESCTCPDFQQRQKALGQPCKHILAGAMNSERAAGESSPAATDEPTLGERIAQGQAAASDDREMQRAEIRQQITSLRGRRSCALLSGLEDEVDALDAEITRLHRQLSELAFDLNLPED